MSESLPPSMLNSVTYWLPANFWGWLVVLIFILALIYATTAISGERKKFLQDGSWITWQDFQFFAPAWWTQKYDIPDSLFFYRSNYDWFLKISYVTQASVENAKIAYFTSKNISLDPDAVTTTEKSYCLKDPNILDHVEEFLRIESTATEQEEERIYLDITWIKLKNRPVLELISKSSVLSGGIEGPYAEEVIKEIKFKD